MKNQMQVDLFSISNLSVVFGRLQDGGGRHLGFESLAFSRFADEDIYVKVCTQIDIGDTWVMLTRKYQFW